MKKYMKLIEPTIKYEKQIEAYRSEFMNPETSMDGSGGLRRFENVKDWLVFVKKHKKRETTPKEFVPATQYIFVREEDNKIVGMLQIRHYLNDNLLKVGGHIGYSVAPSERRKGYAGEMLRRALRKCKKLGIDKALITCDQDNEGSRKTILKNGGVYDSTIYSEEETTYVERYWVKI